MSVVINTNSAASIAANNLARSNSQLQASLNRLSSGSKIVNPSDDAGGLAVSSKLSATSHREEQLQSGISDATSYAQTQDGALQVAGSILDRISELKTLYQDPTKNSSDQANYNDEFTQLQAELTSLGSETFNGISLFGTGSLSVDTTEDLGAAGAVAVAQQDLLGSPDFATFSDDFSSLGNWTITNSGFSPSASVSGNNLDLSVDTGSVTATSTPRFSGAFRIATTFTVGGTNGLLQVKYGGTQLASFSSLDTSGSHTLRIDVDASGNSTVSVDGTADPFQFQSGLSTATAAAVALKLGGAGGGTGQFGPITVTSLAASSSNTNQVAAASSLGGISLSTITNAIQDVATMRAQNGAEQSRLNFASTLLTTNQTNLQSAISTISDVDVASETTRLAKWNVLVQAGTSMLTQANQSAQIALKLITG